MVDQEVGCLREACATISPCGTNGFGIRAGPAAKDACIHEDITARAGGYDHRWKKTEKISAAGNDSG
jgi:hypothetical protein